MKLMLLAVVCVSVVLLVFTQHSEAKVGFKMAPFVWAKNLAKDAAQTLVAYKLSLATKALAMITGNRSFKATIVYDSQLERYAADEDHDADWSNEMTVVTAAPNPVHINNEVKVEWLPGVAKPVLQLPTLPPFPKLHIPKVVVPSEIRLPTLPPLPNIVNKVVVPKIVVPPIVVPDLIQTKAALLKKLSQKSSHLLAAGPKYASGFITGDFRVGHGHGAAASHSLNVQLGSGHQQNLAPVTPAVGLRAALVEDKNTTVQDTPCNTSVRRPVRSVDSTMMGRYFDVIQANDEGRCVALMVCSMAANPQEFGAYGRKVVQFFEGVQPSSSSSVAPYKKAAMVGRSGDSCKSHYSGCRVNTKYLAQLGESQGL